MIPVTAQPKPLQESCSKQPSDRTCTSNCGPLHLLPWVATVVQNQYGLCPTELALPSLQACLGTRLERKFSDISLKNKCFDDTTLQAPWQVAWRSWTLSRSVCKKGKTNLLSLQVSSHFWVTKAEGAGKRIKETLIHFALYFLSTIHFLLSGV